YRPDPGTELPYTQDDNLPSSATVAYGPDYASVFDYIIAIDYNRVPGHPPTDTTRPMGWDKGGGIWLHLDHDSGTNGCVTLEASDLKWLLRTIDPDAHPRIALGPVDVPLKWEGRAPSAAPSSRRPPAPSPGTGGRPGSRPTRTSATSWPYARAPPPSSATLHPPATASCPPSSRPARR